MRKANPDIDSKRKKPYIDYLIENNQEKLINLIEFWKINRYSNLFLYRLNIGRMPTIGIISDRLAKLRRVGSRENELVYDVIRTNINSEFNDLYVFLKVRSEKRHFKSEEYVTPYSPIELDYRKPYFINVIFHVDDSVLECRTLSIDKAEDVSKFFIERVFSEEGAHSEQVKITNEQLTSVDQNTKCTELNINGEYFGANQIIIKGPDTHRCLNEMESKGLPFREMEGIETVEVKNEADNLLIRTNFGNGIIKILGNTEETIDPYRYIKRKVGI